MANKLIVAVFGSLDTAEKAFSADNVVNGYGGSVHRAAFPE